MSTHNICFCGEVRKYQHFFGGKKVPYHELGMILSNLHGCLFICIVSMIFFFFFHHENLLGPNPLKHNHNCSRQHVLLCFILRRN